MAFTKFERSVKPVKPVVVKAAKVVKEKKIKAVKEPVVQVNDLWGTIERQSKGGVLFILSTGAVREFKLKEGARVSLTFDKTTRRIGMVLDKNGTHQLIGHGKAFNTPATRLKVSITDFYRDVLAAYSFLPDDDTRASYKSPLKAGEDGMLFTFALPRRRPRVV